MYITTRNEIDIHIVDLYITIRHVIHVSTDKSQVVSCILTYTIIIVLIIFGVRIILFIYLFPVYFIIFNVMIVLPTFCIRISIYIYIYIYILLKYHL